LFSPANDVHGRNTILITSTKQEKKNQSRSNLFIQAGNVDCVQ